MYSSTIYPPRSTASDVRQECLTHRGGGLVLESVSKLAEKVLSGALLTREDAEVLTRIAGDDIYDLFYWANKIRIQFVGRDVKFCAIVAAKVGGCSEDCKFCAQSEHFDGPAKNQSQL